MVKIKDKNHPAILALKDYQSRKNLNREDLADAAGVGLVTINRLMSGDIPREDTLRKIETNLQVRLTAAYQLLASHELGEYPKGWCDDLLGDYIVVRQNRWLDNTDIINTFPVRFEWCNEKPGLKMVWEFIVDPKNVKRQSAYVSMTSRDGSITIVSNQAGHFSSTHLQRDEGNSKRLYGIYSGFGQIGKARRAIVSQVVAYIRRSEIDFRHDNQVHPGAAGHSKLSAILAEIDGVYCHILNPPRRSV